MYECERLSTYRLLSANLVMSHCWLFEGKVAGVREYYIPANNPVTFCFLYWGCTGALVLVKHADS